MELPGVFLGLVWEVFGLETAILAVRPGVLGWRNDGVVWNEWEFYGILCGLFGFETKIHTGGRPTSSMDS